MTVVGSLAYSIVANTQNFTAGIAASKAELRTLKEAFLASQSPTERYSQAIEHLEHLAEKFPDKAGALHATIHQMQHEMEHATSTSQAFHDVMHHLGLVIDPVSAGFKVLELGIEGAHRVIEGIVESVHTLAEKMESLNRLGLTAGRLGIDPGELTGLAGAAKELTGIDFDSFSAMLTKFETNLGQAAAEADGPAYKAFQRLGLSVEDLATMPADKALMELTDSLSKVDNVFERSFLAKEIGGKVGPQFVQFLSAGDEKIREISEHVKELEQVGFINRDEIHEAVIAMEDFQHRLSGVMSLAASEFAPLFKQVLGDIDELFGKAAGSGGGVRDIIQGVAVATATLLDELEKAARLGSVYAKGGTGGVIYDVLFGKDEGKNNVERLLEAMEKVTTHGPSANSPIAVSESDDWIIKAQTRYAEHYYEEQHKAELKVERDRLDTINRVMDIEGKAYEANEKKAESIAKSQMNGAEKLREEFTKLQELEAGGFFDLHPGAYQAALGDLRDKAENISDANRPEKGITNAVHSASREGIAARFGTEGTTEKQLREQQKHTKEQQQTNALLGEVKAAILAQPAMGVVP